VKTQVFAYLKECEDDSMPHYFSEDNDTLKSNPKEIAFRVHGTNFTCFTDHGVFAKDGLDRGTYVLLQYLKVDSSMIHALDLGCGYGSIGLVLAKTFGLTVDMVDVNQRAIDLSNQNAAINGVNVRVFYSQGFEQITKTYDLIVTNPPIRIGKQHMYKLFEDAKNHLTKNGELVFVINKKHGALSAIKYVETLYQNVEIIGKSKGFFVISCKN